MDQLLRKDVMELDQLTSQGGEFYQPPHLMQFTENQVNRWAHHQKRQYQQLVSPPGEDEYYYQKYQPSYYGRDETHLFTEQSKQTNDTTNTEQEIKASKSTKKEPRKPKREPHNAIERKRRNNINENIKDLGELLPENMCQGKVSKGTILKGSVLYVKTLKDQLTNYKLRLDYLERQVAALNGNQQLPL